MPKFLALIEPTFQGNDVLMTPEHSILFHELQVILFIRLSRGFSGQDTLKILRLFWVLVLSFFPLLVLYRPSLNSELHRVLLRWRHLFLSTPSHLQTAPDHRGDRQIHLWSWIFHRLAVTRANYSPSHSLSHPQNMNNQAHCCKE